ncbi:DUF6339 family protein [Serratia ureilytica]|uniref:DUF6339 family protein n=1 Tax=Serratia ureilytica TaxID=300181 RepID=UPI0018D93626|nr:DUF6339 family protein [Serratia ureilytica]MBH2515592.1 hypothetical protein [Serratia ureilytica]MBH2532158.1 hypothetical protein [Serratia ureilytica]MCU6263243.1 hypothetical protein [Serratia ureilytica]BEL97404.1 hypothetical protein SM14BL09_45570 [Serratia marcescens]
MSNKKVLYLGQSAADYLYEGIGVNIEKYMIDGPDFSQEIEDGNWNIPLSIDYIPEPLQDLKYSNNEPESVKRDLEIENSILVWSSLRNLTPVLACENRIWSRFTHTECLKFTRNRWDITKISEEKKIEHIKKHFFAINRTHCRDDNAISRLWWNAWIASQYSNDNFEVALRIILRTADIRSNLIERPWMFRRREISNGIIRFMSEHFLDGEDKREARFRQFSKTLNMQGAGVIFEGMNDSKIDAFIRQCYDVSESSINS